MCSNPFLLGEPIHTETWPLVNFITLAQLVSPSVALLAELVSVIIFFLFLYPPSKTFLIEGRLESKKLYNEI